MLIYNSTQLIYIFALQEIRESSMPVQQMKVSFTLLSSTLRPPTKNMDYSNETQSQKEKLQVFLKKKKRGRQTKTEIKVSSELPKYQERLGWWRRNNLVKQRIQLLFRVCTVRLLVPLSGQQLCQYNIRSRKNHPLFSKKRIGSRTNISAFHF